MSTVVGPDLAGFAVSVLVLVACVVRAARLARRRVALRRFVPSAGARSPAVVRLDAVLLRAPQPPPWAIRCLRRAGLGTGAAVVAWRWGCLGSVAALGGVALVVDPVTAAVAGFVLVLAAVLAVVAIGDRATTLVDRELPDVLATVAAGVRSGASLTVALCEGAGRARGPVAEDLARVADELATGRGLIEVLERWVQARPTPGVRMTGAALTLAAETGGAGARTIDGVAATLRDRLAVDRELAALASQARASAVVIGLAPVAFVVLTALSDPEVWTFLLRTPAGLACLAAGCLLDAVGAGWMTTIARGAR